MNIVLNGAEIAALSNLNKNANRCTAYKVNINDDGVIFGPIFYSPEVRTSASGGRM